MRPHRLPIAPLALAVLAFGAVSRAVAQSPLALSGASAADARTTRAIRRTLDTLYATFSFDAGGAPNWTTMRALFLPGAAFVDPIKPSARPHAIDAERFIANFRQWVEETPKGKGGFKERIVAARIDHFGHVAHAYVTFEGFLPGVATAEERGLDSIQLVLDGATWKIASLTTQYEQPNLAMPTRFGGRR